MCVRPVQRNVTVFDARRALCPMWAYCAMLLDLVSAARRLRGARGRGRLPKQRIAHRRRGIPRRDWPWRRGRWNDRLGRFRRCWGADRRELRRGRRRWNGGRFVREQDRHPVHDRQLVVDDRDAAEALRAAPDVHDVLQSLPTPPNLHVAVVSSDMGAPGDSTSSIGCTDLGDQRRSSRAMPRGTCTATTLTAARHVHLRRATDSRTTPTRSGDGVPVHRAPRRQGLRLRAPARVDRPRARRRRLGPRPATNAGFLRPDAYLGIVILTNEDDCSAPHRHARSTR